MCPQMPLEGYGLSPWLREHQMWCFCWTARGSWGYKNKMGTQGQTNRWKYDRPPSLQQFMADFPDDSACAEWLFRRRWPDGFVCPLCEHNRGWRLESKPWTCECAKCGKQTSVTAGTIMHGTHLPLRTWFIAAHLVATHSNGISALQLQAKAGIGSYKTAWLLLHKANVYRERQALTQAAQLHGRSRPDAPYGDDRDRRKQHHVPDQR